MEDGIESSMIQERYYEVTEKKAPQNKFLLEQVENDIYDFLIGKTLEKNSIKVKIERVLYFTNKIVNKIVNEKRNKKEFLYEIFLSNGETCKFVKFQEVIDIYGNICNA